MSRALRRAQAREQARQARRLATAGLLAVSSGVPAGAALIVAASPAQAAGFQVTNLNDSGAGSLRNAISAANGSVGVADTITFAAGLSGTLALTGGELLITDDLTITGPGAANVTVNAGGTSRIFHATSEAEAVVISGLTLTGGAAPTYTYEYQGETSTSQGGGGAVLVDQQTYGEVTSETILSGLVITDSEASRGGGALLYGPDVTVANSSFTGNSAPEDGALGVFGDGHISVENSTFTGHLDTYQAVNLQSGVVVVTGTTVTATDGVEVGEYLYGGRGAELWAETSLTITGSSFTDNDRTGALAGNGGGSTTVADSGFTGNGAGGLAVNAAAIDVSDSQFADNDGRGARLSGPLRVQVTQSSFTDNSGGGLAANGAEVTVVESILSGNHTGYSAGAGLQLYGLYREPSTASVTRSQISGNTSLAVYEGAPFGNGGGVYVGSNVAATIENTTITGNAAAQGGGVYLTDERQQCLDWDGVNGEYTCVGGFETIPGAALVASSSTIAANTAAVEGGGIMAGSATKTLRNSIVADNTADGSPSDLARLEVDDPAFGVDFSLVEAPGTGNIQHITAGSNITGQDPQLGALASNGGPTKTMLPPAGSPVVDKGNSFALANDQRGLARPVDQTGAANAAGGDGADMGAVELANPGLGTITNTTPPTLSDTTPTQGQLITASPGTWSQAGTTATYQWLVNGTPNGATGATYTPVAGDVGKTLAVRVTVSKTDFNPAVSDSAPSEAIAPNGSTPLTNITKPTLSTSMPRVGEMVFADDGTWSQAGVSAAYAWLVNGVPNGATGQAYIPVAGDIGKTLAVRVTVTKSGFSNGTADSNPSNPVAAALPPITNSAPPTLSTTSPIVGQQVTASPGTWSQSGAGVTTTYQWFVNGVPNGATGPSYTPGAGDAGKTLKVRVTVSKSGFSDGQADSAVTAAVAATPPPPPPPPPAAPAASAGAPSLAGQAKVGKKLKASVVVSGCTPTYQWLRNGKAIKKATKAAYKLTAKDRRKKVSVRVTCSAPGVAPIVVTSAAKKVK